MYEEMQLAFIVGNDNLDLGWTTNGNCILQSLIFVEKEPGADGFPRCLGWVRGCE
jgi:hypothetical protein